MEPVILHCDINSFYASVEELYHPESRGKPIAVAGSVDQRHGIILAKNIQAKKYKINTGEAIWQAKLKCPDLIIYQPNYARYLLFSKRIREIFHDYTDLIEPFGLDEAWLDVTASRQLYGSGEEIADKIRERIYSELGVTASVGVSFNKIFAKLGSDLRKPNYTTVISKDNFKQLAWPLSANELLYVGGSTYSTLKQMRIYTIGDLANADEEYLRMNLGKMGAILKSFANGQYYSPVSRFDQDELIKTIGNSVTCYRDLCCKQDLDVVLTVLCESVGARLRQQGFKCKTITLSLRDNKLNCCTRQMAVNATNLSSELFKAAQYLYQKNYHFEIPLPSIGVRASHLTSNDEYQLSLFVDEKQRKRQLILEETMQDIRDRYGFSSIKRATVLLDKTLSDFNPKDDHIIFPESYF